MELSGTIFQRVRDSSDIGIVTHSCVAKFFEGVATFVVNFIIVIIVLEPHSKYVTLRKGSNATFCYIRPRRSKKIAILIKFQMINHRVIRIRKRPIAAKPELPTLVFQKT